MDPLGAPPPPSPPPAPRQPPKWPFLLGGTVLGAVNLFLKGDALPVDEAERAGYCFGVILGGVLLGVLLWFLARRWVFAAVLVAIVVVVGFAGAIAQRADSGAVFVEGCKRGCVRKAEKASPDMVARMERVCGCLCERLDERMSPELRKRTRGFDAKAAQEDPEMRSVMGEAVRACMASGASGAAEEGPGK